MQYKFSIEKQIGDNTVFLEGEMEDDGGTFLEDVTFKGESIYEMLASVAIMANKENGFSNVLTELEDWCAERFHEVRAEARIERAEFERDLRDDR